MRSGTRSSARSRTFAFRPDVKLRIGGGRLVLRHFEAEYRPAVVDTPADPPDAAVTFALQRGRQRRGALAGGHKTVRWSVALREVNGGPLEAAIRLRGLPVSFGLSLVQGYFVEPILSLAAARKGSVLLPAAAVAVAGKGVVLMGRSRSGKSTLTARALASGIPILGDDQVIVDRARRCWPFPRRMRFYSDLRDTAPDAFAALPAAARRGLVVRGAVRRMTRGFVAPPVRVSTDEVGPAAPAEALPLARVVLIERLPGADEVAVESLDREGAVSHAIAVLDDQRAKLRAARSPTWHAALDRARTDEGETLRAALEGVALERVVVPADWLAPRAVAALAEYLGLGR